MDYFIRQEVNLNKTRREKIVPCIEAIYAAMMRYEELSELVTNGWTRQGSWAQLTLIRPVPGKKFDADIQLELDEHETFDPKDYLRLVRRALQASPTYHGKLKRKDRCVRVEYEATDGEFHVDIVPLIRPASLATAAIVNFRENEFESTNPQGFTDWLKDTNDQANGQLRKCIKLLKWLRNQETSRPPSVIITLLTASRVSQLYENVDDFRNVSVAFVELLERLHQSLGSATTRPYLSDPSCSASHFHDRWDDEDFRTFKDRVERWATAARLAIDAETKDESLELWQNLFGSGFKKPPSVEGRSIDSKHAFTASGEQFIEDEFPINLDAGYVVEIVSSPRRSPDWNGTGGVHKLHGQNRFKMQYVFNARHDVASDVEIYWKLRNHDQSPHPGGEIVRTDELVSTVSDTPVFTGSIEMRSYVECFIVRDGVCIAYEKRSYSSLTSEI